MYKYSRKEIEKLLTNSVYVGLGYYKINDVQFWKIKNMLLAKQPKSTGKRCANCKFCGTVNNFCGDCNSQSNWQPKSTGKEGCVLDSNKKFRKEVTPQSPTNTQIPLTQGYFATIDSEDYDKLSKYKWYAAKDGKNGVLRATRHLKDSNKRIYMTREIINCPEGMVIDHINHDTLDNRKCNLRICTQKDNSKNRKISKNQNGYKGIRYDKKNKKYDAKVSCNGKTYYICGFDNKIDAAKAYDKKALELFGEFACINFPSRPTLQPIRTFTYDSEKTTLLDLYLKQCELIDRINLLSIKNKL